MPNKSDRIERVARAMASADPDMEGQINDGEMGDYFWEKYRDRYEVMARAAIAAIEDEGGPKRLPPG